MLAMRRRGRTFWLWTGGVFAAVTLAVGAVVLWANTGNGDQVTLRDVVAAVIAPGKVFHAQCSVVYDGTTTGTTEQWYSSGAGVTRVESRFGGNSTYVSMATTRQAVILDMQTGRTSIETPPSNRSGTPLGPPELLVTHVGTLAEASTLTFERARDDQGEEIVSATASSTRSASDAGEDEPAGDPQTITWLLDATSLLPRSAHFRETLGDGHTIQEADIVCPTAEMLDAATVDPALFDVNSLKPAAP